MVNRERFMLDVDSEGFPIVDNTPFHETLAIQRLGNVPAYAEAQGLLADAACRRCEPAEYPSENPEGWREVAGVQLPAITWGVPYDDIGGYPTEMERMQARRLLNEMNGSAQRAVTWAEENLGDIGAKGDLLRSMQDCANINCDGITRLSDSYAPDAYYGWKR